jgi:hypothetical protein
LSRPSLKEMLVDVDSVVPRQLALLDREQASFPLRPSRYSPPAKQVVHVTGTAALLARNVGNRSADVGILVPKLSRRKATKQPSAQTTPTVIRSTGSAALAVSAPIARCAKPLGTMRSVRAVATAAAIKGARPSGHVAAMLQAGVVRAGPVERRRRHMEAAQPRPERRPAEQAIPRSLVSARKSSTGIQPESPEPFGRVTGIA